MSAENIKAENGRENRAFFIGIIYTGKETQLRSTLKSVYGQHLHSCTTLIYVFHPHESGPVIYEGYNISFVPYSNDNAFFKAFMETVALSNADYYCVLRSGEEFFAGALDSVCQIFANYNDVAWLTGIQTFKTQNGFSISLGNTAIRRWTNKIYEQNLYKNSGRYIPPASTFWKKSVWQSVSEQLHFVSLKTFCEDLWLAFFKSNKLYTCKIYFSTGYSYDKVNRKGIKLPNSFALIEDSLSRKMLEFFFINNIPYLRLFYRSGGKLAPVIRFDHDAQSYFLSDY